MERQKCFCGNLAMNDWLTKSKDQFQDQIFDFLWRQWSTLGIAGTVASKNDNRIIDPEALLLFSLGICRYEPRLFDEIIDWLFQNGRFINVQRLQQIQHNYDFHCGPQLGAIAGMLAKKTNYRLKWSGLAKQYCQLKNEPLFFNKDGSVLPCPQEKEADPDFLSHGLRRGPVNLRGYSQPFDSQNPACLLLRLRALFGISARAEILCLLASIKEIHPSRAARITSYYQKTIQTTLVEMAQSGVILTRTSKKEKFYRLKPQALDSLLKPNGQSADWICWPPLFKTVEVIWEMLCEFAGQEMDTLLLYSELKKRMSAAGKYCSDAENTELILDENLPMEGFDKQFQEYLLLLNNKVLQNS
jgi:hypothetical protein